MEGILGKLGQTWPVKLAESIYGAFALPGQVASGVLNVPPSQPGMWSDEDEAKSQATQGTMMNRAADLGGLVMGGAYAAPAMKNASGMGIRAYHRSPNDFDKFDLSYTGTTTDPGKLGTAHYFSTDANVASAGPRRYEAEVSLKNPIELRYPKWGADKQSLITERLGLPADAHAQDIRSAAMKRGHDGVVLDYSPVGYNHKEIAAYSDDLVSILRKYGILGPVAAGGMASGNEAQSAP
jgi:hypothetical protein